MIELIVWFYLVGMYRTCYVLGRYTRLSIWLCIPMAIAWPVVVISRRSL